MGARGTTEHRTLTLLKCVRENKFHYCKLQRTTVSIQRLLEISSKDLSRIKKGQMLKKGSNLI